MDNELMNTRFEIIKLLIQSGFTNNAYSLIEDAKKICGFIEMNDSEYHINFSKNTELTEPKDLIGSLTLGVSKVKEQKKYNPVWKKK